MIFLFELRVLVTSLIVRIIDFNFKDVIICKSICIIYIYV